MTERELQQNFSKIAEHFEQMHSIFKKVGIDMGMAQQTIFNMLKSLERLNERVDKLEAKSKDELRKITNKLEDKPKDELCKIANKLEELVCVGKTITIVIAFMFGWFIVKEWLKWIH